ncbi:hypothetical protein [Novosphingobium sp.]|uniref:hypothetical protein n=1 Tax=Novosphingobium sp. TaxID=1874826 RepID=UPI001EC33303|nr:hypothetical protein [Novosphingobium sp.]MBK9009383.1 hypothetical protein [Novosphingobium sp.]
MAAFRAVLTNAQFIGAASLKDPIGFGEAEAQAGAPTGKTHTLIISLYSRRFSGSMNLPSDRKEGKFVKQNPVIPNPLAPGTTERDRTGPVAVLKVREGDPAGTRPRHQAG